MNELQKQAEEITGSIIKRAEELVDEVIEYVSHDDGGLGDAVEDNLTKMSEEDLEEFSGDMAYARGVAYGEAITKVATMEEAADVVYTAVIEKIAEKFGEDVAEEVDKGLKEGEPPLDEIAGVATEAAAQKLIEQAGGEEAIKKNPEVAKEIVETAAAIGKQVASEVAAESAPTE